MQRHSLRRFTLGLLLLACTFAVAAQQQPSTPPPVKMGLWKTTHTATVGGIQLPPEVAERLKAMGKSVGQSHTVNALTCITPEKWQQMFNGRRDENCTYSNQQQSASGMSADITCTESGETKTSGHMEMTFDNSEKIHGKFHLTTTNQSQPQPLTVDSIFQGVYQGSDCQGISPDRPKIIQ